MKARATLIGLLVFGALAAECSKSQEAAAPTSQPFSALAGPGQPGPAGASDNTGTLPVGSPATAPAPTTPPAAKEPQEIVGLGREEMARLPADDGLQDKFEGKKGADQPAAEPAASAVPEKPEEPRLPSGGLMAFRGTGGSDPQATTARPLSRTLEEKTIEAHARGEAETAVVTTKSEITITGKIAKEIDATTERMPASGEDTAKLTRAAGQQGRLRQEAGDTGYGNFEVAAKPKVAARLSATGSGGAASGWHMDGKEVGGRATEDSEKQDLEVDRKQIEKEQAGEDGRFGKRGKMRRLNQADRDDDGVADRVDVPTDEGKAVAPADPEPEPERPASFLPRKFYFENIYLGGNAAYAEQLRRLESSLSADDRPYLLARLAPQSFDVPSDAGLALTATLDRPHFDRPGRLYLQVGLQGSQRYGWRRPPLDVMLVVDAPTLQSGSGPSEVTDLVASLLQQLGPLDRLGVLLAGPTFGQATELAPLSRLRLLRTLLPPKLEALQVRSNGAPGGLAAAFLLAGQRMKEAADDGASLPGTQTVLLLTRGAAADDVQSASQAAHELTLQGIVTSVVQLGSEGAGQWWPVANAGYGNYHRVADLGSVAAAVGAELETLSRVVARLLRLNVRLGKDTQAIRVLGSRVLDEEEAQQVKAREVAADRQLSRTMGISSDRGEDDDGIQTVIPYFYGGDSHVVLVELWADKPGEVAEVTLRYKDMVNLKNATARTAVTLRQTTEPATGQQRTIHRNIDDFRMAELLEHASIRVRHGDQSGALQWLQQAQSLLTGRQTADRQMLSGFLRLVGHAEWLSDDDRRETLTTALLLAGRRKVGEPPHPTIRHAP